MRYGYARVSTVKQDLDIQIAELHREGCDEIVSEKYTGTTTDRPLLTALLDKLQEGDTLIVTKLDRFARNIKEGSTIIEKLFERGIKVHVLNMGLMENTAMGRVVFNVVMAFAQFERDMIVERTQEGKEAKKGTFVDGRPKALNNAQRKRLLEDSKTMTRKQLAEIYGVSEPTIYRELRKVKTLLK